jgi:hypothetical protein
MDRPWRLLIISASLVIPLLVACSPPEACSYGGVAKTWIDSNENGQWDDGESPLPGVQVTISGDLDAAQGGITDEKGEVKVGLAHMSCGASFSICVEPMPGYRLTTQRCFGEHFPGGFLDKASEPDGLLFGFVPDEDQP